MQREEIMGGRQSKNRTSENSKSINTWNNVDSYLQKYNDRWKRSALLSCKIISHAKYVHICICT
jgi:hypothetical protein